MKITLAGNLATLLGVSPEQITQVRVKAPAPRVEDTGVVITQPEPVTLRADGRFSIEVVPGRGWMYIDGDGWSDSIPFVASEGVAEFVIAVAMAGGYSVPLPLVEDALKRIADARDEALTMVSETEGWLKPETVTSSQSVDELKAPGQYPVNNAQGLPEQAVRQYGALEVLQGSGSPIQRYTTWSDGDEEVWVRSFSSSTDSWSPWGKQTPSKDTIENRGKVADLNEARTPGVYFFATPANAPEGMSSNLGTVEVLPSLNALTQRIVTWSMTDTQMWVRSWSGSRERWTDWRLVSDTARATQTPSTDGQAAGGEPGLKTVPLAVSTGRGGTNENASGTYRYLMHWGAPITRWRVHISNVHPQYGASRGDATLGNVELRQGETSDVLQARRVDVLLQGTTTIKAGEEFVSQWRTDDLTTPHFLQLDVDGTNFYRMESPSWKYDGAKYVPSTTTAPLWIWVEAETYSWTPVVALLGDSTGAGSGATLPVYDSTVSIEGRRLGFLPVHYAHSGDTLGGNVNADDPNYTRWAGRGFATADSVVVQAGSNDLHGGYDLAELKDRFTKVAQAVKQLSPVVLGSTIKPRYPVDESVEATRQAYNEWMRTQQPGGVRGVVDFDKAVAPQGTIRDEFSYDRGHLTTAGHEAMAKAFQAVTVARPSLNRLLKGV